MDRRREVATPVLFVHSLLSSILSYYGYPVQYCRYICGHIYINIIVIFSIILFIFKKIMGTKSNNVKEYFKIFLLKLFDIKLH